jgi:hypothetical protein
VPFVSPDTHRFRDLEKNDLLVRNADGSTAIRHWWNGYSAVLDVSNPAAVARLCEDLDCLVSEHGIDGFKFDAGDLRDFRSGDRNAAMAEPTEQCEAWARIARRYRFNELRACWKMGGQPLAQRLHDKPPLWGARGLLSLVPESIAQGLIGHPFVCPDMVGGGDVNYCSADRPVDQELFVRYAQCAALFPMMQFSMAPARVLDVDHVHAVQAAVRLRQSLATEILDLVNEAAASGEPILLPLAYHFSVTSTSTTSSYSAKESSSLRCFVNEHRPGRSKSHQETGSTGTATHSPDRERLSCRWVSRAFPGSGEASCLSRLRPTVLARDSYSRGYRRCAPLLAVAVNPTGARYPAAAYAA